MSIATCIKDGNVAALHALLSEQPELANTPIIWGDRNECVTDPLHFVSDVFFNTSEPHGHEAELTTTLLAHGANVDGTQGQETPLIGATSLGAQAVAHVLLNADANLHATSIFGSTALHWAAYMGTPDVVTALIDKGAAIDVKCEEFQSTPLFWAVQGFSQYGPEIKLDQVEAARELIIAGADLATRNIENVSLIGRSCESKSDAMTQMLIAHKAE